MSSSQYFNRLKKYCAVFLSCPCHMTWHICHFPISSVQFSRSVVSNSLRSHESQHARPPCPSPAPGVYSNPWALLKRAIKKKKKTLSDLGLLKTYLIWDTFLKNGLPQAWGQLLWCFPTSSSQVGLPQHPHLCESCIGDQRCQREDTVTGGFKGQVLPWQARWPWAGLSPVWPTVAWFFAGLLQMKWDDECRTPTKGSHTDQEEPTLDSQA